MANLVAEGPGWSVRDIVCTAGPQDRPFLEQHGAVCIALVTEGSFRYRTTAGTALLGPGALLLGEAGRCFECGHEHGAGDRCLSFHFAPDLFEGVAAEVPGVRTIGFDRASLPPLAGLARLVAEAEAERDLGDWTAMEEIGLRLAGAVLALAGDGAVRPPGPREARRIAEAVRLIERRAGEPLALGDLASRVGMSRYHFLRTFRQVVGLTPHQFVLRQRLHRAAVRILGSDAPISTIAFEAGFNDLSTFNHRFRATMGQSPGRFRAARRGRC